MSLDCSKVATKPQNVDPERLINEAIKSILLDVILRGHGDRLIGRWSREPDLQRFLEQVPYLLDRVNQLHLACCRVDKHEHHEHHYHHHTRRSARYISSGGRSLQAPGNSSLSDFVGLIGQDQHWLVRTRDPLGLTPLHKAILYNNLPVAEYILDRYADQLAVLPARQAAAPKLLDAQDKYGRTPLHYAAGLQRVEPGNELYHFLLMKGASTQICDFRGKMPGHYLRHPEQLRHRCIMHLANKLNAQYQANVLTKTLRLSDIGRTNGPQSSSDRYRLNQTARSTSCERPSVVSSRCASMSMSCGDLTRVVLDDHDDQHDGHHPSELNAVENVKLDQVNPPALSSPVSCGSLASSRSISSQEELKESPREALKSLVAERLQQPTIDARTRDRIRRCLNEGSIEKVNELLVDGFGGQLVERAALDCWNQLCRRYICSNIPNLLVKLDALHECIARNQIGLVRSLLNAEPQLARIKRAYKRAHFNALHLAVRLNRRAIVKHLLTRFPELASQTDSQGANCLHWAARSTSGERLFRWLNKHFGALLSELKDARGKTALDYRQQVIQTNATRLAASPHSKAVRIAYETIEAGQQVAANKLKVKGTKVNFGQRGSNGKNAIKTKIETTKTVPCKVPSNSSSIASVSRADDENLHWSDTAQEPEQPIALETSSNSRLADRLQTPKPSLSIKVPDAYLDSPSEEQKRLEEQMVQSNVGESLSEVDIEIVDSARTSPPTETADAGKLIEDLAQKKKSETSRIEAASGAFDTGSEPELSGDDDDDEDDDGDDNIDGDDDERVEKLSSEFEERIRREKSELQAKVDQIMNDIKSSTRTESSSNKLLSDARKDPQSDGGGNNGSQSTTAMFVAVDGRFKANNSLPKPQQASGKNSRSSSGNSSACTSASSRSSTMSSTYSSSSSSSLSTKTASNSCATSRSASACSSAVSSRSSTRRTSSSSSLKKADNDAKQAAYLAEVKSIAVPELERGIQVVSKNNYGQTYLHFVASRPQTAATFYKVLNHGSHLIAERDIFYRTARDVAVQFNLMVNARVIDKFVIDLFVSSNTAVLRHLLVQGYAPLIHVADIEGNDIMLILKLLKLDRMINFLLQMADFQRWRDELHTFIRNGYRAGVCELVRKHSDLVRACSVYSRSSIHLAVLFDRLEMVEELIGADPKCVHALDCMGRSALHFSYGLHLKQSNAIRAKLIEAGSQQDLRDVKMRTPKYYYIFRREIEDIRNVELELN